MLSGFVDVFWVTCVGWPMVESLAHSQENDLVDHAVETASRSAGAVGWGKAPFFCCLVGRISFSPILGDLWEESIFHL
jgi:hypothetical protein